MSVVCGHQQGYQQEGTFCSTRQWISSISAGRKFTLHTDMVFSKKRRLYIYGSWVVPWTSQELVHIWCISMNYQLFHFSTMVEILHLDLMGKRWTNILKCHSNLTSGMPAAPAGHASFCGSSKLWADRSCWSSQGHRCCYGSPGCGSSWRVSQR